MPFDQGPPAYAMVIIALCVLIVCAVPVALVLIVSRHRRSVLALRHKTVLELAQRGVPVSPEILMETGDGREHGDLRNGLVLAATGAGVIAFALTLRDHQYWGIGLIPLFAGLGYFATWLINRPGKSSDGHA